MKKILIIVNFLLLGLMSACNYMLITAPDVWIKAATSACFLLVGAVNGWYVFSGGGKKSFALWTAAALALSFAGDVVNYFPNDVCFIVGVALFALAHVCYIVAYATLRGFSAADSAISAVIFIGSALVLLLLPIFEWTGAMKYICLVYAAILSLMAGKALGNLRVKSSTAVVIALASVLFFTSDLALVINMFSSIHAVPRVLCLATYYPAQFLLAFAIFLHADSGMGIFKAAYCRIFQFVLKLALPFLPYRDPKILHSVDEIPTVLTSHGKTRPLIVTDGQIHALGLVDGLTEALTDSKISYSLYDGVVANPTTDNAAEALAMYKADGCDCLIAIGGGSPIDCAKAVGALVAKPKKSLGALGGILKVGRKIPLLFAVPTTAGTGSETTLAAVIVDSKTRRKYAINDFPLIPSYAVLDPALTAKLPPFITATTGMDALTHAVEAYIGKGGNRGTRRDALAAAKLVLSNITAAYAGGDEQARNNMLLASHMAGRAFSKAYVGYVHALAHALGGKYNIAHGYANAVILPAVLSEYGAKIHKKLWKIAVHCELVSPQSDYESGATAFINKVRELNSEFNIPAGFTEIVGGDIEELAAHADREANPLYPVPVLWGRDKLQAMYRALSIPGEKSVAERVDGLKQYFDSGKTLDVERRIKYLEKLYDAITDNLDLIHDGLKKDLGKSSSESYMCETGLTLSELSYMIKHTRAFASAKRASTPLASFPSTSKVYAAPYGTVLIMNPWNYPFLLSMEPLIDAVAAGNTVALKLSAYSPHTDAAIAKVIGEVFPPEYVSVFFGGADINKQLMAMQFDYVFFTGSKRVGQLVYESAAKNLTPVTLELGGKSPCIVDETANIPLAARRIVWGKYLNLGQTCVAPDYVFVHADVHDRLLAEIKKQIVKQFGADPLNSPDYGKMINVKHFERVRGLIDSQKAVVGGKCDESTLKIEPTVLDGASETDAAMQEEIFGPVLPVMTFTDEEQVARFIKAHDAPLAFYVFSSKRKRINRWIKNIGFGGGCVNNTVMHLVSSRIPFGGYKQSGLGGYHGKYGFDTFTHKKSVVKTSSVIDLPLRYRPFGKIKDLLVRIFLR